MDALIEDAQAVYRAAVRGVQPDRLFQKIHLGDFLDRPPAAYRRVVVAGAGKASMAMAGAVEALPGLGLDGGLVVVPHGYRATLPATQRAPASVEVVEAGHPVPDAAGVEAAGRTLALAASCTENDLLLVLISGGGSALWSAFADGIALDDARAVFRLLLHSGADIHAINTVRKHLSRIGGGHLAAAAFPATVLALVVSDVVGDDLSVIASGPTVPDATTYDDAVGVLRRFDLWEQTPASIRRHLQRGLHGEVAETPGPGHAAFDRTRTVLLGGNGEALAAAHAEARARGYAAQVVARDLEGEARTVGQRLARQALETPKAPPTCLLWGGETTVTVTGQGRGGRNQEVALAAALALEGSRRPVVVLSGGTDGIDGPTDAAGAWATPQTVPQARRLGLDPEAALADNDAYPFFQRLGALLQPGPTHTNVMDLLVVLSR